MPIEGLGAGGMPRLRPIARQLLPGMVLPGVLYLIASRFLATVPALTVASAPPLADVLARLFARRPVNPISLAFLALASVSVGLALWLGSSLFILARGAVVSALLGLAFALSAAFRRPLTRTLAIRLTAEHDHVRSRLAELWEHPAALRVFRVISVGWGLLLLVEAAQQALVVLTFSPGAVVAFEPPLQAAATVLGIVATLLYAKRVHTAHPELALLPSRSPA